jgi:hypothetical protein
MNVMNASERGKFDDDVKDNGDDDLVDSDGEEDLDDSRCKEK